ncbi:PIG-L deacetylase family protein [Gloeobacter kilaueensis]|uniref:LmbE family protein n=1 Tax=Gloeobacter kilaueensis (strain ATCC BAA-2537 / CCAP 1431/1 / ULC 316 / JS1) TaxID=1183438 RepID=U5QSB0_GLOK1|nr:PIG-L deacetylase family protein [Gloeobacter kilaueensis]AGY60605.1 LmbE family protein [Gloeobacter kilaueensis JS1]
MLSTNAPRAVPEGPLLPSTAIQQLGPALVVAPHPDDETLGCGGAIALLRKANIPVEVLVVSDGTRSHPGSRRWPAPALRKLREAETREALGVLGVESDCITFLGLPDGAVPFEMDLEAFAWAVQRCRRYLDELTIEVRAIVLPWRRDPHADHRAAWNLLYRASGGFRSFERRLEYPIWLWEQGGAQHLPQPWEVGSWRLDIAAVIERKLAAIAAHRSQTSDLIDDDPDGFRLTPETLAFFERPWECYLEAPCSLNAPH